MTPQQIVGMATRLFSLWLIIIAFQIFGIASAMNGQLNQSGSYALYLMPLFPLLLAVFLWFFPMYIAHKIVPRTRETNTISMQAREATVAASAIIGIWVIIASLPQLVAAGSIVLLGWDNGLFANFYTPERTLQLISVFIQCVFGLFLVAKPRFIAGKIFPNFVSDGID